MKRGRKPGTPKTGGRQPGQRNKVTSEMKTWLQMIVDQNRDQFLIDLAAVEPEKRLQILEKIISYLVPKPQSFDLAIEYRHLERLLQQTPEQFIEQISLKLLTLNKLSNENNEFN